MMLPPFGPPSVHVFSSSEVRLRAWRRFFDRFAERAVPHTLRWRSLQAWPTIKSPEDIYALLEADNPRVLTNLVAIVDLSDITSAQLEALSLDRNGDSALERYIDGMRAPELALRFPEVYWIFIVPSLPRGYPKTTADYHFVPTGELSRIAALLKRHGRGFRTWFDCTGLRELLRHKSQSRNGLANATQPAAESESEFGIALPGVSLDEETGHCIFNGYVLYRNGRRAFLVNSLAEMKRVLLDPGLTTPIIIEDVELQFDDADDGADDNLPLDTGRSGDYEFLATKEGGDVETMLELRLATFPILRAAQESKDRILVSGIENPGAFGAVSKPLSGMFDQRLGFLWRAAGARTRRGRWWLDVKERGGEVARDVRNFRREFRRKIEPPRPIRFKRHSAAYRRQHVAERLLARARLLKDEAVSVETAVHVATLAREARLLLENENFTLSLEAIGIQYRMEVLAECISPGGAASLSAPTRFWFLRRGIDRVTESQRKRHNAMVSITNDLHEIYRSRGQHVAADDALDRLRVHRWHLAHGSGRSRFAWLPLYAVVRLLAFIPLVLGAVVNWFAAGMVEAYFNFLMRSFTNIVLASAMWIALFAAGYDTFVRCAPDTACSKFSYSHWVMHSSATFLALQPGLSGQPDVMLPPPPQSHFAGSMGSQPEPPPKPQNDVQAPAMVIASAEYFTFFWMITILEMLFGFVHLGVLVSYLFQRLTR